ncbi:MAG TPA: hypothetical protein VGH73_05355 [Thermoanaerobaculia bacterium]|jgi:hypothetical protein
MRAYAAFDHVREKGGCRGVDGVSVEQFHEFLEIEIDHLQDRLIRRRYHPLPLPHFPPPLDLLTYLELKHRDPEGQD